MTGSIGSFLADFTKDTGVTAKDVQDMQEVISMLPKGYGEGGDWVNRVFEAYENGFSEGEESARTGEEERHKKLREELEAELAEKEKRFKQDEGQRLKDALEFGLLDLEDRVSTAVAQILVPFLEERARSQAVEALQRILRQQLSETPEVLIEARGPQSLYDLFEQSSGQLTSKIKFTKIEQADLELKVADMTLSTGLQDWCENLRNTLGE